jgi:hypothetical protein
MRLSTDLLLATGYTSRDLAADIRWLAVSKGLTHCANG